MPFRVKTINNNSLNQIGNLDAKREIELSQVNNPDLTIIGEFNFI